MGLRKDEMRGWARSPQGIAFGHPERGEMSFRMRSMRFVSMAGAVRLLLASALAAALAAMLAVSASAAMKTQIEIVTQGAFPSEIPNNVHYFHKIQEGVEATKKGSWVLIEPGIYNEEVKVKGKKHEGIHIRGMDRNTVILDGTGLANPKGSNGIEIGETQGNKAELVNNVWVENLTARNFEQEPGGSGGNEFWWSGGDETAQSRRARLVGSLPDRI